MKEFIKSGIPEIENIIGQKKQYGAGKQKEKNYCDIACEAAKILTQFLFTNGPHARENKGYTAKLSPHPHVRVAFGLLK